MLSAEGKELLQQVEQGAKDWPWENEETASLTIRAPEYITGLIDSFGFDDPSKRGLLLCMMISRGIRMGAYPGLCELSSDEESDAAGE